MFPFLYFFSGNVLFYCASAGQLATFAKFLDRGVPIEPDMDGMTLLMEAAYEGIRSCSFMWLASPRHFTCYFQDSKMTIGVPYRDG